MVPLGTYIGQHYSWRYALGGVGTVGLLTLLVIQFYLPVLSVQKGDSFQKQMGLFKRAEIWLIILITAIGTGGLFCWISYIAPLMTQVSHFPASRVPSIMMIAGLGMCVGNVVGGKLADRFTPVVACLSLLLALGTSLLTIYFVSGNQALSLIMTFITGSCSMALGAPIQILMIRSSKGAELLGASLTQAAFNMGNALGAFLGGLPIAAGYGYASPELVGVGMTVTGATFAFLLLRLVRSQTRPLVLSNTPVAQEA